ncbi:hypothetical protein D3C73_436570 [compost metagenome]|jgi:hypothetical protein
MFKRAIRRYLSPLVFDNCDSNLLLLCVSKVVDFNVYRRFNFYLLSSLLIAISFHDSGKLFVCSGFVAVSLQVWKLSLKYCLAD